MNFLQALTEFLAFHFPGWGVCRFSFDSRFRTLYCNFQTLSRHPKRRSLILSDAKKLTQLDIGVQRLIFVYPNCQAITVPFTRLRSR